MVIYAYWTPIIYVKFRARLCPIEAYSAFLAIYGEQFNQNKLTKTRIMLFLKFSVLIFAIALIFLWLNWNYTKIGPTLQGILREKVRFACDTVFLILYSSHICCVYTRYTLFLSGIWLWGGHMRKRNTLSTSRAAHKIFYSSRLVWNKNA